jgi:hypothetical protein
MPSKPKITSPDEMKKAKDLKITAWENSKILIS